MKNIMKLKIITEQNRHNSPDPRWFSSDPHRSPASRPQNGPQSPTTKHPTRKQPLKLIINTPSSNAT